MGGNDRCWPKQLGFFVLNPLKDDHGVISYDPVIMKGWPCAHAEHAWRGLIAFNLAFPLGSEISGSSSDLAQPDLFKTGSSPDTRGLQIHSLPYESDAGRGDDTGRGQLESHPPDAVGSSAVTSEGRQYLRRPLVSGEDPVFKRSGWAMSEELPEVYLGAKGQC